MTDPPIANPSMSPIDEIWEAFGTRDHPEVMVNAEEVFNGIKMRAWRGIDPFSDDTWADNEWHDTSESTGVQRAQEAISAIRTVISLFEYLNHDTIRRNRDRVFNDISRVLHEFDAAVARVRQVTSEAGPLHLQFLFYYLIPRIEGVDRWIARRLEQLQDEWDAAMDDAASQPGPSTRIRDIQSVLNALTTLKEEAEERIIIDTSGIEGDPRPP